MHEIITTMLVCGIFSILYIIYIRTKFSRERSKYHNKTIKLYLNYQFTTKILQKLKDSNGEDAILPAMKEYFALDEIAIFKYANRFNSKQQTSPIVTKYIENNIKNIISALEHQEYVFFTLNIRDNPKDVIIQYLNQETKLFVLYTTSMENKLSQDDIEMITNIVLPIINISTTPLKNRAKNGNLISD